ncbi:preprotein translocase subunit SecA [Candidatus Gottesmanbacteria bacterium]|nr:preprotein translocase subunit SecA [Candidatus Gottesmanbacteria bacterium]
MFKFISRLFDTNQKEIDRVQLVADKINSFEGKIKKLKDKEFPEKTAEFKTRLASGTTIDNILPEAFALVREAALRTIGQRHFDVQLMAAVVLHEGKVAEQKTGEGKTLSAVPALYLNSLTGKGVHLVTVNDYLARRDAGWMGTILNFLGVTTGAIIHDLSYIYDPKYEDKEVSDWRLTHLKQVSRKEAYQADVTYGINSEFGFDYLRDNMVSDISRLVQRGFHYAVVDEVDSVLIDEARTPHIISAPDTEPTKKYYDYARMIDRITPKIDYEIDEKHRTASLSEKGIAKIEKLLGVDNLYEKDFQTVHHIEAALKSRTLFIKDRDYVVKDNQVIIVDEFTGRLLPGRRFSEGLHQAIEAKEGVTIQQESKTLATVSLQNYFRMYEKLAGMTGTAATESEEFHKIYNLDVVVIPTNRQNIRKDSGDVIYKTLRGKYAAVAREIEEYHKRGQPVLVGTTSIEHNEIVSRLLRHKGIPYEVLNAKNHEREAQIIAKAGEKGAVTVATNMAGRGVDIILGGEQPNFYETKDKREYHKLEKEWKKKHDEVLNTGGLHIIGTERHESRRIDNQLRGRAGRQGDPGSSRFFVSLEDDLMRIFGGEQISGMMTRFNIPEDQPLSHGIVSRAIEQAQVKVEGFHFDSRKHLVEYDDVLNKHREIIYGMRKKVLESEKVPTSESRDSDQSVGKTDDGLKTEILTKVERDIRNIVAMYSAEGLSETERETIIQNFVTIIPFDDTSRKNLVKKIGETGPEKAADFLVKLASDIYDKREKEMTPAVLRQVERFVNLSVIDQMWMDHLTAVDDLREGIGLRGYGQRDPLIEYKNEAFSMFESLVSSIDTNIVNRIYRVQVQMAPNQMPQTPVERMPKQEIKAESKLPGQETKLEEAEVVNQPIQRRVETDGELRIGGIPVKRTGKPNVSLETRQPVARVKVGRNDPCPCGSGKKYKKCHYPQYG